jgi:hypothetical protein
VSGFLTAVALAKAVSRTLKHVVSAFRRTMTSEHPHAAFSTRGLGRSYEGNGEGRAVIDEWAVTLAVQISFLVLIKERRVEFKRLFRP